jgi:hypothetical protein
MEEWLNSELDRVDSAAAQMRMAFGYWAKPEDEKRVMAMNPMWLLAHPEVTGDEALNAALSGDLEPIKQRYPDLVELDMLKPPKRGSGKRFLKNKLREAMKDRAAWPQVQAVWDAAIIREIWKKSYKTKPKGYGSPEEIAARRRGVKPRHVEEWKRSKSLPKNPYR